jgi:hypothetical protein
VKDDLQDALPAIQTFFEDKGPAIYNENELVKILGYQKVTWPIPHTMQTKHLMGALVSWTVLRKVTLKSKQYENIIRYTFGNISPYQIALSLRPGSYLSHGTAAYIHGLTDRPPKTIYTNKEQSPKEPLKGELSQEGINKAFANKPRVSQYTFSYGKNLYTILSGKHTGRLGVEAYEKSAGEIIDLPSLERTLIDIVVRPYYAGGVSQVLTAYIEARDRVSIKALLGILEQLAYTYPYHQAIGFYMKKAGYPKKTTSLLKKLELAFDFFLDYGMTEPAYDEEWRIFYPRELL